MKFATTTHNNSIFYSLDTGNRKLDNAPNKPLVVTFYFTADIQCLLSIRNNQSQQFVLFAEHNSVNRISLLQFQNIL